MSRRRIVWSLAAMCVWAMFAVPHVSAQPTSTGDAERSHRLSIAYTYPPPPGVGTVPAAQSQKKGRGLTGCHESIDRSFNDRPDIKDGRLVHVVYLIASDFDDEKLDVKGTLDCSVRAQNDWFIKASGGLRWRFDTFMGTVAKGNRRIKTELVDVTFVQSARPGSELDSAVDVQAELTILGFADTEKRYLSFVASEGGGACGDAIYPISAPPQWSDGQFAQVYLFADAQCKSHDFGPPGQAGFADMIAQQEIIHNDGLVSPGVPHGCLMGTPPGAAHVCTGPLAMTELDPERADVMFPFVSVPLSEKILDIGNDDYFKHAAPTYLDLEDSPYLEQAVGGEVI